jgi:hypothetical protein
VEALRFRRDFSHSLPARVRTNRPGRNQPSLKAHVEGSILNMPKAITIAPGSPNGCRMTEANCGVLHA